MAEDVWIRSYSIQDELKPYSRFSMWTTSHVVTSAWCMGLELMSAVDEKVLVESDHNGGNAEELDEPGDTEDNSELELMAAGGDMMDSDELGDDKLVSIATGGGKTGELGELENDRLESNVAGSGMTGELGELETEDEGLVLITTDGRKTGKLDELKDEGLELNVADGGITSKLEDDELELVAATGSTTDKSNIASGELWPSLSV